MFRKILIANRGEIACRIARTARRMGISTVAVFSEADGDALHVKMADEAVLIGPPPAAESYLLPEAILEACRSTGAEAVHPGYGFLSENAAFARMLGEAGIVFIGPPPEVIELMGDKIVSKQTAREAGVNVIPGSHGLVGSVDEAVEEARRIGYPVMFKATAGGGGKGMRIVNGDEDCREAFERAGGEARSSFGDDRIFVEKLIEKPRHIEIQVLGDRHGSVIHLGERECSLQRRHQKVIEEAPSPFLGEAGREAMAAQAVSLCRAVGYHSAGTVEFIVDSERNFYFLEMNTRLQVEHPVTELVTGTDIVELMFRIADGEKLPLSQEEVSFRGWAVESRIYAEDPFRNFLPSAGRLVHYLPPEESPFVRVDTGVYEGSEVSVFYDPMIAKLVTCGATREEATGHMIRALDEFTIRGVEHNISFLAALLQHPRFISGETTTDMIAREYPRGFHPSDAPHDAPEVIAAIAASIHRRHIACDGRIGGQLAGYEKKVGDQWIVIVGEERYPVGVTPVKGGHDVELAGKTYAVRSDWKFGDPLFRGTVGDLALCVQVERHDLWYRITHSGSQVDTLVLSLRAARVYEYMPAKKEARQSAYLLSPMPGLLVSVDVVPGQTVKEGEKLAVVEAMKMENTLFADQEGTVGAVLVSPGESLSVHQPIIEFES
jgi:propionyl-CoA carboxylase alpha chain